MGETTRLTSAIQRYVRLGIAEVLDVIEENRSILTSNLLSDVKLTESDMERIRKIRRTVTGRKRVGRLE